MSTDVTDLRKKHHFNTCGYLKITRLGGDVRVGDELVVDLNSGLFRYKCRGKRRMWTTQRYFVLHFNHFYIILEIRNYIS